jgi:formylmethanofuran:tetrahydromethanopterin formyltransferase
VEESGDEEVPHLPRVQDVCVILAGVVTEPEDVEEVPEVVIRVVQVPSVVEYDSEVMDEVSLIESITVCHQCWDCLFGCYDIYLHIFSFG